MSSLGSEFWTPGIRRAPRIGVIPMPPDRKVLSLALTDLGMLLLLLLVLLVLLLLRFVRLLRALI